MKTANGNMSARSESGSATRPTRMVCMPICSYFVSESRAMRLCRFLRRRGYEVHVLGFGRPDLPDDECVAPGIFVHRFRVTGGKGMRKQLGLVYLQGYAEYVIRSALWIAGHNPALVHFHDWGTVPVVLLSTSFWKRKTIYDVHEDFQDLDYLEFPRNVNRFIAWLDRLAIRMSSAAVAVCNPIGKRLENVVGRTVHVVRNIPDVVDGGTAHDEIADVLKDGRRHFVFLGNVSAKKGATFLLSLLGELPEDYCLVLLSKSDERQAEFERTVEQRGLKDRVRVFPPIPQKDIFPTIRHAFAGISAITGESPEYDNLLPNKFFEYLHAGLPVISTQVYAQSQLIRAHNLGLVVDVNSPADAARAILNWTPPIITRARLEEVGLTWRHEEKVLADILDRLDL